MQPWRRLVTVQTGLGEGWKSEFHGSNAFGAETRGYRVTTLSRDYRIRVVCTVSGLRVGRAAARFRQGHRESGNRKGGILTRAWKPGSLCLDTYRTTAAVRRTRHGFSSSADGAAKTPELLAR